MLMWRSLARLLKGGRSTTAAPWRPADPRCDDLDRYAPGSPGAQRIARVVGTQLEAADTPQPRQWRPWRAFVFGYVDALADLHACNAGLAAQGPQSRALSAAVLRSLSDEMQADELAQEFAEFADAKPTACDEFAQGRWRALDDYEHWSERDMSGLASFIDDARSHLLRLEPQPEVRFAADTRPSRNALLSAER
jgi:hypothetical protein